MTHTELRQRATDRAKAEHLRTWKLAGTPHFLVKSRMSEPGAMHRVTVIGSYVCNCDCKGWEYRKSCTHAAAVERRIERESRKRAA